MISSWWDSGFGRMYLLWICVHKKHEKWFSTTWLVITLNALTRVRFVVAWVWSHWLFILRQVWGGMHPMSIWSHPLKHHPLVLLSLRQVSLTDCCLLCMYTLLHLPKHRQLISQLTSIMISWHAAFSKLLSHHACFGSGSFFFLGGERGWELGYSWVFFFSVKFADFFMLSVHQD